MITLQQVHEFVNHDVFEALHRLFGQFQVQPYSTCGGVAASPLGLHFFDAPVAGLNAQDGLPLLHQRRDQDLELLTVPAQEGSFTLRRAGNLANSAVS